MKNKHYARWVIYRAKDGWRWRLKASNGRIVADSGEAYATERGVTRAVAAMLDFAYEATEGGKPS